MTHRTSAKNTRYVQWTIELRTPGVLQKARNEMQSGLHCLKVKCHECCHETEMPLSLADIKRLKSLGYKTSEFMTMTYGERRLRNVAGKCYFLTDNGCKVYSDRPKGCKFYPLVVDSEGQARIDKQCKHHQNHNIKPGNPTKLHIYLKLLKRERRREIIQ